MALIGSDGSRVVGDAVKRHFAGKASPDKVADLIDKLAHESSIPDAAEVLAANPILHGQVRATFANLELALRYADSHLQRRGSY